MELEIEEWAAGLADYQAVAGDNEFLRDLCAQLNQEEPAWLTEELARREPPF